MKSKKCELCGMIVSCGNYSRHLRRHQNRPESFNISPYSTRDDLTCIYCGRKCKNKSGLNFHEKRCHDNPNRIIQSEVMDYKAIYNNKSLESKQRMNWNKGKTALTDERVKKHALSVIKYYQNHQGTFLNKNHTQESKDKIRNGTKKYITLHNIKGNRYSVNACNFIDMLNKRFNWNLVHGMSGGEYHIGKYSVDGYDKDLNIVFEYDDSKNHYKDKYGNILSDRDLYRQRIIIEKLKCRFVRYNPHIDLLYEVTDSGNVEIQYK